MLHTRLVNALTKAGATVSEDCDRQFSDPFYKMFVATYRGQSIDWYTSQNWNNKTKEYDGRLYVGHTTWRSPHTDVMTDCFCDSYRDTIKGSLALLGL